MAIWIQASYFLHLTMLGDIAKWKRVTITSIHDIKEFLKEDSTVRDLLPEVISTLRLLKTYLQSTMGQKRLNNIPLLNARQAVLDNLDLRPLVNEYIKSNTELPYTSSHLTILGEFGGTNIGVDGEAVFGTKTEATELGLLPNSHLTSRGWQCQVPQVTLVKLLVVYLQHQGAARGLVELCRLPCLAVRGAAVVVGQVLTILLGAFPAAGIRVGDPNVGVTPGNQSLNHWMVPVVHPNGVWEVNKSPDRRSRSPRMMDGLSSTPWSFKTRSGKVDGTHLLGNILKPEAVGHKTAFLPLPGVVHKGRASRPRQKPLPLPLSAPAAIQPEVAVPPRWGVYLVVEALPFCKWWHTECMAVER
ncbi:hypothetical protein PR048_020040 [Dryococelus australis]|uniref:Uncharacterized protein n=1 Tax=Dryococelus australis TaxID=614101 RepID=A0ABQ9H5A4_9NEOP|nr:hypothetical protein PR048_020040 [Dryococelus australis]